MYENFKELGLYTYDTIQKFQDEDNINLIDCIEGCLIDNLLFYDTKTNLYYLCIEYEQNEWASSYQVCCGIESIIYDKWNQLKDRIEIA